MRLGVIDVGSNTVHLLVVDAHPGARPLPAFSHKRELRLAEHTGPAGDVASDGIVQLVEFVQECTQIAEDQGVQDLMGFATSAVREAPNGDAVLAHVTERTGVELEVLSGEQEARLTFLAARRWFGWSSGSLQLVDIGGGSLELAAGIDEEPDVALSLPLGAGRLTRQLDGDPPSAQDIRELRREVRAQIATIVRPLTKVGRPDRAVGTSKTIRSLARICGAAPSIDGPYVDRFLTRADATSLVPRLSGMSSAERASIAGVSAERAPQLLAGAIVVASTMDLLGIETLQLCPWALREGIILRRLDWLDG